MLRKNSQVRKLLVSFLNEVRQNSSDITKDRGCSFFALDQRVNVLDWVKIISY